ncbi:hypothetical protein M433DRAFT_93364 [Acidomyces richmondensis BFW]|nr:MAG: hypothetical protein FE78DRAFT_191529 [Acidomyces sp. 'richmondensis']KYG43488.1 hypothetical protein M433DRAFT_93364 [Acidomyces richmondensis BFW]
MGSRLEQKSKLVRKRIDGHTFDNEQGEEYEASAFGGFSDYFRRKKIKLQNLDAELRASSDRPQIFKGIVCHVNGYTQPSLNDLHVLIVKHGGGFIQYLDGKTMATHIIASNLTPKKKEEFRRYRIVKPAWIVDSINAGKLLPWDTYRVVDEGMGQKVLGFENGQFQSLANRSVQSYREQTDTSWYTSQLKANDTQVLELHRKNTGTIQTVIPDKEIEDDEYPMPEITSSMERALDQAETTEPIEPIIAPQRTVSQFRCETQSLPPSSPRSQEPEYSMAVIRNSDKLRTLSPSRLASMTAEEHNAILLSDPKIRKSTVVHPDFLEQYYRESRLHHLSTWKAELKSQLQALAAEQISSQKAKLKKLPGQRRYIMHVDFDSFFAAVSLKKYPQYQDKPAVVAHGQGSGSEIASCNYLARKFGIRNGMWMRRAQELCSELKILPYDFPGYEAASKTFYEAIMATGGIVQSVSIDEALVDISAICFAESGTDGVKRDEGSIYREQAKADNVARSLRDEVLAKTGCTVSVGIGGNILQAKVALRKAKPAGQYHLKSEEVLDFIGHLEVQNLPGVAWSIGGKLEEIGVKLVRDIREVSKEKLISTLGPKTGEKIWEYARGIDRTEVGDQVIRKSVSAEVNWGVRFENQDQVDEFMHGLCSELHKRLVKERVKGRQLTMKVMRRAADAPLDPPKHLGHGKCDTYNKSIQLGVATNDAAVITKEAIAMVKSFNISPGELRGIGVQMQKLDLIKARPEGGEVGSQKRLQFKTGRSSISADKDRIEGVTAEESIRDDIKTPKKQHNADANQPIVTALPANANTPTAQSLNIQGTQFVLPTQVDPSVLAELPEDIQAKLCKRVKPPICNASSATRCAGRENFERLNLRPQSPTAAAISLPTLSQIDPTILAALPEDVRAEVLAFYQPTSGPRPRGDQTILPQSRRKHRVLHPSKIPTHTVASSKRKRGGGGLFSTRKSLRATAADSTLTQSNFVIRPTKSLHNDDDAACATTTDTELEREEELDPDVLAALPEDLRREILDQRRLTRLQRRGGIDLSVRRKGAAVAKKRVAGVEVEEERRVVLPPRPQKPTFTARKLWKLEELREAVGEWVRAFSSSGDDEDDSEPYEEDVEALGKYLRAVVIDEGDMNKATAVVKWLAWVIEEEVEVCEGGGGEKCRTAWAQALEKLKEAVRAAVRDRGLGRVDFE